MSELPNLKGVEPIATCDVCGSKMYIHAPCQSSYGAQVNCPMNGQEWRQIKVAHDMRPAFPMNVNSNKDDKGWMQP